MTATASVSDVKPPVPPPTRGRRIGWLFAVLVVLALTALAWHFNVRPRHKFLSAVPDTVRVVGATGVVFALSGFGLVRLLLPAPLRRYELLWVLPTGACACGITLTVLGFAYVPYAAALPIVLVAGTALAVYAVRRRGWPEVALGRIGWPAFLAAGTMFVALVPMLAVLHYAAPVGTGSDAHLAVGSAEFLKHAYPTSVDTHLPVNQMPPTWQSKFPIYYAFAAVSSISGLATWQVLAPLEAAMLALAALGMFLLARDVFRARWAIALVAMGLAALDHMALYTVLNPYFNQTWGFFAMPFALVLGWWLVQPGLRWRERRGIVGLLVLFAVVLGFAYPLALPIPAVPIVIFVLSDWRRRIKAGEDVFRPRDLYRGRRSLLWIVPVAALLVVPAIGVGQKVVSAVKVLAPGSSLAGWGGDLGHYVPWNYFFSGPNSWLGWVLFAIVVALVVWGLANQVGPLAWGLGGLFVLGLALAVYLRHRQFGYYFEFKLLAFVGPLMMLIAALGAARVGRAGLVALAALLTATGWSVFTDIKTTGYQLGEPTIQLATWAKALPKGASVRLDMWPPYQLWVAYFMDARPLCSQLPLLRTDYPHVAISRKADYILAIFNIPKPADAIGPAIRTNDGYRLYRENPDVPGPSTCTYRRFDRIYTGAGHSWF